MFICKPVSRHNLPCALHAGNTQCRTAERWYMVRLAASNPRMCGTAGSRDTYGTVGYRRGTPTGEHQVPPAVHRSYSPSVRAILVSSVHVYEVLLGFYAGLHGTVNGGQLANMQPISVVLPLVNFTDSVQNRCTPPTYSRDNPSYTVGLTLFTLN